MKTIIAACATLGLLASAGASAQMNHNQHRQAPAAAPGGHMMQHGQQHGGRQGDAKLTEASKAYLEAMDKMHAPMMEGARDPDADAAFVKGMIPHHQGAIDMARIVLKYGKDEQIRKLANDVISAQEREIAEMQAWLKKNGHAH